MNLPEVRLPQSISKLERMIRNHEKEIEKNLAEVSRHRALIDLYRKEIVKQIFP